jgi:hypothetical protein
MFNYANRTPAPAIEIFGRLAGMATRAQRDDGHLHLRGDEQQSLQAQRLALAERKEAKLPGAFGARMTLDPGARLIT